MPEEYGLSAATNPNHVLIVDQSAESREVLRALLARSGTSSIEASRATEAVPLAEQLQPELIVLDAESDSSANGDATRQLTELARSTNTPIVLIGKISGEKGAIAPTELVPKPYHYSHLLRKIEDVLEQRRAA